LHPEVSLRLFKQRHIVRDGNRHVTSFSLLLNETPFKAEIIVAYRGIPAEAWFG
jgi:hypothetical protein